MDAELRETLANLAAQAGFELADEYCSGEQMRVGVRQIASLVPGATITAGQRRALMENVRLVILGTATVPGAQRSVAAQAALPRWEHLRAASIHAAEAYAAVLSHLGVEVPEWLLGDVEDE